MARSTAGVRPGSARRAEIVRVAAELFDKEGYHQTSMETLAARAGVAKPTLYHYFAGKEAILREIHRDFIEPLIARHEMRLTTSLRPRQLLLEAMGDVLELMETHRGHVRVFFEHHRELPPTAHAEVQARRDAYESHIEGVIARGMNEGEFRSIDVRLTTLSIFGMCNWAYQWFRSDGSLRPREIAYLMWDIVERGIGVSTER
jgi:AcrR family transcriptional regulator